MTVHVRQLDGSPLARYNCTAASAAMLIDAATGGNVRLSGADVRRLSRKPQSAVGLSLADVAPAFTSYGLALDAGARTRAKVAALLAAGTPMILQGKYDRLPRRYRSSDTFTDGHAVYVESGQMYDPLAGGPMTVPADDLLAFSAGLVPLYLAGTVKGTTAAAPSAGSTTYRLALRDLARGVFRGRVDAAGRPLDPDAQLFSAAVADAVARIGLESLGGGVTIDNDRDALLRLIRAAVDPFVGRTVRMLPATVDVAGVPEPRGDDPIAGAAAIVDGIGGAIIGGLTPVVVLAFILVLIAGGLWLTVRGS
jgi:hypothetical protein